MAFNNAIVEKRGRYNVLALSSQDPLVRLLVALGAVVLAVTGLLAGGLLLFVEHAMTDFDVDLPRVYMRFASWGLMPVVGTWVIYMLAVAVAFGYRMTENRGLILFAIFLAAAFYNIMVVLASLDVMSPFFGGHMIM